MSDFEREQSFLIAQNEKGELLISIESREGDPVDPLIVYDGKDHAILYRSKGKSIVLDYINPSVRETLSKAENVSISETDGKDIVLFYETRVKHVPALPLSDEFMTLEELLTSDKSPKELLGL
ncbi:MAG: hypothetical protein KAJ75_07560 [Alphaproteobacteria bacterium]|nr:hypothetical protein [Alphaproteobacteria bacterium]